MQNLLKNNIHFIEFFLISYTIHLNQEYVLVKYLPKDNITEPIDIIEPRSFGLDISAMYTLAEFVPTAKLKY